MLSRRFDRPWDNVRHHGAVICSAIFDDSEESLCGYPANLALAEKKVYLAVMMGGNRMALASAARIAFL
jgi:hypothetical protein